MALVYISAGSNLGNRLAFLQQGMRDVISYDDGLHGLAQLLGQA